MPKFDFNHLDHMGRPRMVDDNKLCKLANLMSRKPSKSGYIWLLNNNIDVNTVGNVRSKTKVYYDAYTSQVSSEPTSEDAVPFREARLRDGSPARFWITDDDLRKTGWNGR